MSPRNASPRPAPVEFATRSVDYIGCPDPSLDNLSDLVLTYHVLTPTVLFLKGGFPCPVAHQGLLQVLRNLDPVRYLYRS
jgi:hypothetical protein